MGIDFLSILGPSWPPTWAHLGSQDGSKSEKMGPKLSGGTTQERPKSIFKMALFLDIVLDRLGFDFWGVGARFSMIFGGFFELLGLLWACVRLLLLGFVFVVLGYVFSQLCQENPRTCRGQSRESKNLPRTKPRTKSVRTPPRKLKSQSFVLLNSFPYRKPPYSKNVGRRYSPQGGFNPPDHLGESWACSGSGRILFSSNVLPQEGR